MSEFQLSTNRETITSGTWRSDRLRPSLDGTGSTDDTTRVRQSRPVPHVSALLVSCRLTVMDTLMTGTRGATAGINNRSMLIDDAHGHVTPPRSADDKSGQSSGGMIRHTGSDVTTKHHGSCDQTLYML
ncbi:hypothetical protein JOB18_017617 [Solea senegalensis]|uniref:Uncharacterized protein n=1 Tax=Solea senegalensis TaxID=28829 RepID=A0AAV6RLC5_SOLSE|nr:hypothetical protein JOB18_017617 [Solea senegalensis]